ncbi:MAG: saccharopine dehydrogenase NADP-binding domain-containing protein [Labilithrix sp.]|nr:saccharopine dehydrogenase NADP-binding domain-containing protein [Labilithrix sp.]
MKVVVLGAGLVGSPMALDLAKDPAFDVTVADLRAEPLERLAQTARVTTRQVDLAKADELQTVAREADIVLSAVPGFMGFRTLEVLLEMGKTVVDIAFFSENPLDLDPLAKKRGATAIVDMGVGPGMSSVLAAHAHAQLDETTSILTYVGGLPRVRRWPYEYKAVFSPIDVIEEYIRPARYIENGHLVVRPALSDAEYLSFPEVGTLEAFNTDGLRTMAVTMNVPNMKEKTLRYPGHIEKMAVLRETGFFGAEPVEIGGAKVRPIDLTAKLLFPMWTMEPGEADVTVMKVIIEGTKAGKKTRVTYDLFDTYDAATGIHSMARTTGYTATSAVRMLAKGLFADKGVFPPELVGRSRPCVEFLLAELRARGVVYQETIEFP